MPPPVNKYEACDVLWRTWAFEAPLPPLPRALPESVTAQGARGRSQIITETLPALAELKKQGLVRHIGITGLPLKAFRTMLDRRASTQLAAAVRIILS